MNEKCTIPIFNNIIYKIHLTKDVFIYDKSLMNLTKEKIRVSSKDFPGSITRVHPFYIFNSSYTFLSTLHFARQRFETTIHYPGQANLFLFEAREYDSEFAPRSSNGANGPIRILNIHCKRIAYARLSVSISVAYWNFRWHDEDIQACKIHPGCL